MLWLIITIIAFVSWSIISTYLTWVKDKDQLGRKRLLLLILCLLSVITVLIGYVKQYNSSIDTRIANERLLDRNQLLLDKVDTLSGQQEVLREDNRSLIQKLDSLRADHRIILVRLENIKGIPTAISIPVVVETQLMEVQEGGTPEKDSMTGVIRTQFVFRARNVTPLRDIRIQMSFDKPVLKVTSRIKGAFVIEQGTIDSLSADRTTYIYRTGYLSQSNDILIEVMSKDEIQAKISLSP